MPYLIDGHNLIPKVGLRLDSVDDELDLVELLQQHGRASRSTMEVFFDGAPPGQASSRKFGRVTATFVSQASSADAAIRIRLRQLGAEARNWTVVSSDREVLLAAKGARARTQTSEEFAARVRLKRGRSGAMGDTNPSRRLDGGMTDEELQRWLDEFKKPK